MKTLADEIYAAMRKRGTDLLPQPDDWQAKIGIIDHGLGVLLEKVNDRDVKSGITAICNRYRNEANSAHRDADECRNHLAESKRDIKEKAKELILKEFMPGIFDK